MKNIIFILCLSFLFSIHYVAYCNSHKQDIVLTPNRIISKVQELTKPNAETGNDERIIELLNYALKEEYRFKKTQKDFFRKLILEKITNDSVSQDSKIDYLRIFERFPLALKYDDKIVNNHLWITSRDSRSVKLLIIESIYYSGLYTAGHRKSLILFLESHMWEKDNSDNMFFLIEQLIMLPPYSKELLKSFSESADDNKNPNTARLKIDLYLEDNFGQYNGAKDVWALFEKKPGLYMLSLYAPRRWGFYLSFLDFNENFEQNLARTINNRAKVVFFQQDKSSVILFLEFLLSNDDTYKELIYFNQENVNSLQLHTNSEDKKLANLAKKCIETRKDLVANCKD